MIEGLICTECDSSVEGFMFDSRPGSRVGSSIAAMI